MIDHRPFGIDDPYKRLATERHPRDAEAGDAPQIGFRTSSTVGEAWVSLDHDGRSSRHPAQRVSEDTWIAQLPPLDAGAYAYTLHARGPEGAEDSEPYDLPVARWREATRVLVATPFERGLRLVLEGDDGARATVDVTAPLAGVARTRLSLGAPDDVATEGPPCRVVRDDTGWTLHAEGVEARIDDATLALTVSRPGGGAVCRTDTAPAWLERPDGTVIAYRSRVHPDVDEALHGLGERFAAPGLRGSVWDTRVYEEYKEQGQRTYIPVPFFVSQRAWGVWYASDAPARVDARGADVVVTVEAAPSDGPTFDRCLIVADTPYEVTAAFTELTGAIAVPPRWAYGPWMSANPWNDQAKTTAQVDRTLAEDVPATVLVIEAWSDESTFYVWNDAAYEPVGGGERLTLGDFRFGGRWPDPKALIDHCHANGIRVLLWQIPVQKKLDAPHAQHAADEAHMLERGYAIAYADGTPYRNRGWWFTDALVLDVTNPDACQWWFDKRRYLFDELGIDGMKTDGGEHLWGRDLMAWNGQRGTELVNRYAQAYVDAYHQFVQQMTGGDGLTFSRAGTTGAQRSPAHWAGDENSTWSAFRSSIQAGLTVGLAGVSIWGWDIGGFSGEIPTVELYVRSTQMAAFCPVMQYHSELNWATENRDRTPWNIAERHGDPRALTIYRAYARLRTRLVDHIAAEAQALAAVGQPLMRYPALVWPERHDVLLADPATYLFGRDLLVCPVLEKGAETRAVTLPPGTWVDFWSGARFEGDATVVVPAPLARIPVFVRAESPQLGDLLDAGRSFEVV